MIKEKKVIVNNSNFLTKQKTNNDFSKLWTKNEMEVLFNLRSSGIPYKLISYKTGRTIEGCKKKFLSTDWKSFLGKDYIENEEVNEKKSEFFQKRLDLADVKYESNKISIDILSDKFAQCIQALPKINIEKYDAKKTKTLDKSKEEHMMLMLSDIHIGSEYSLEETGGLSEFNTSTLERRINNLKYSVKDIYNLHSHLYKIPSLHIACLGDVVAGDNSSGEWSPNYISLPIVEQVISGYAKIRDCISYWLTIFDDITFYGIRGNHGRTGRKGVEKDYSNYDYLCYKFLEESFKNNNRIKFVIPKSWWLIAEIKNHKFLMVHGDDIKSGSLPIKKLYDFESKMTGILKKVPDYTLAGHFHSAAELSTSQGSVLINGSFMGGDIYSLKNIHANNRPEQIVFGINNSRGKTWKYNIDLETNSK